MDWILVTNDDGVHAPGLPSLIREVSRIAPVKAVVPDRERSWIGKAITRHDPIRVGEVVVDGLEVHSATGYPADCVQLGVNTLFDTQPRLVVSGINVGYNHGSAYLQSSGTVGAVLEGGLAGVDGVAFSTGSHRPWPEWKPWAESDASLRMWEGLAVVAAAIAAEVFTAAPSGALLSVNLPDQATVATPRRLTTVAEVGYDRLFSRSGDGTYVHDFGGGLAFRSPSAGTDVEAASEDVVAVTPIRGAGTGSLPDRLRDLLAGG
jgi:5'-nucleotidase